MGSSTYLARSKAPAWVGTNMREALWRQRFHGEHLFRDVASLPVRPRMAGRTLRGSSCPWAVGRDDMPRLIVDLARLVGPAPRFHRTRDGMICECFQVKATTRLRSITSTAMTGRDGSRDHGLPALPDVLCDDDEVPIAYWAGPAFGAARFGSWSSPRGEETGHTQPDVNNDHHAYIRTEAGWGGDGWDWRVGGTQRQPDEAWRLSGAPRPLHR